MTNFSEIKEDYETMRKDFKSLHISMRLTGGMKSRRWSNHDIDITVTLYSSHWSSSNIENLCWKWNYIFTEKHNLSLDVLVQRKTKNRAIHVYDFDYRVGLTYAGYPIFMNEAKHIDGKWVAFNWNNPRAKEKKEPS